ncbi:hypothetical protein CcaverHIS002_0303710 [Cutaneotrichosporon cavernicola]|uniref:DUF300-domain-containing protein n=1 Tax=Cutaneotrichosporon cavernicola TaxID=279322 RepID=A0AA48I601_9TREE|nr:uncharacterized protein CcaverHIS019_0303690 [Cutaneotrichosporon cavernicola]BEI82503.1 hypothetical protein CcaverHIS002_0303710 [Cutaneotrichosporon cavernicola]BEI90299.1 hypothetical protein CcaverHIS019_0303690 [Cutaneotrichosporon cavernicola]BEI98075.1 hypothetical protein CcaverHIS631_0303740 [Cutaneotrichosporon cavernicola]
MSLPSFPGAPTPSSPSVPGPGRGGAGDHLPGALLAVCGACTLVATVLSIWSIVLQLKNYRMPALQRCVVRIMVMVPLYALSSLIALYSLNAAFFIDAIRDLYEGFVIYTFLQLLITYLGGERDLLLRLNGRPPIPHTFPLNLFFAPMDPSDPWTLLNLKRGVLQYVQIKPLLVIATAVCKWTGTWKEGEFTLTSGYTYVTIVYNISICLSLYCLAMFWVAVSKDLKPFRPVPKFLCVKGILFFSFWQGVFVGFLVSAGFIKSVGPYTDPEHMVLALVDSMICIEMPFFAIAHQYAFRASDYIDSSVIHVARLPFIYAARDAFGVKDVWEDIKDTFRARGVSYKAYEAADGGVHYGVGRQKRIRAGLRYSRGGKDKYWLNNPNGEGERSSLLPKTNSDMPYRADDNSDSDMSDAPSLDFSDMSDGEEQLYERARRVGYSGFPNIDISREQARRIRRHEENGILAGRRLRLSSDARQRAGVPASPHPGPSGGQRRSAKNRQADKGKGKGRAVYGQWGEHARSRPAPVVAEVDDAHFDGEIENPGAWRADSEGVGLGWTHKPKLPPVVTVPEPQPKMDEVVSPASREAVAARSDAVDLVSAAQLETPETRTRSLSAAAMVPEVKPVKLIQSPHEEEPSPMATGMEARSPPKAVPPRETSSAPPVIEPTLPTPWRGYGSPPRSPDAWEQPEPANPVRAGPPRAEPRPAAPPSSDSTVSSTSFRVPSYGRWEPDDNPWA